MDNKKIIIIGILILVCLGVIIVMLANSVSYERIDITPNGTSIEVPANQTRYRGDVEDVKVWNWNNGILVTYNSHADSYIKVGGVGFDALYNLIKNGEMQEIDGFTCYVINADDLLEIHIFDIIKVNYNGKFYCIPLANETSHDNIIICCNDKDMAVHMAKSVNYKNVYPENSKLDNTISSAKNMSKDWAANLDNAVSTAGNISKDWNANWDNAVSTAGNVSKDLDAGWDNVVSTAGKTSKDLESKSNGYANNLNWNSVESTVKGKVGDLMSYVPF